ncbi:hypothetical protein H1P_630016 [Hyella patelloides LEGE 07179]|uniref:Uncharacterized protein n=1 Tax=Hyella patelloides LEGE 07179 TaxID=945734 RepID=A0A563W1N9_9CYAN|nr:hypothetical protein H1P_630016 [Hyella patelloides LEGE 07179]
MLKRKINFCVCSQRRECYYLSQNEKTAPEFAGGMWCEE